MIIRYGSRRLEQNSELTCTRAGSSTRSRAENWEDPGMAVNMDKPQLWKKDIAESVDYYNRWFLQFAPKAYRDARNSTTEKVETALVQTDYLTNVSVDLLAKHPSVLSMLRMATLPPIARDRLIGLADVPKNLVENMEEKNRLPPLMDRVKVTEALTRIGRLIERLADRDIFPWLGENRKPTEQEAYRAATIVADRLSGAVANPIIRNAQEQRQLQVIREWLEGRGYTEAQPGVRFDQLKPGTFAFRLNVTVEGGTNIPIDVVVMRRTSQSRGGPLLIEAKSAGDFTNPNKRRKEEAQKMKQLRETYGNDIEFILFLCGYFDSGYLGYEAAEGIDWVWEHRIDDLEAFGV